jgi:tellurite resistance protein TehA-like permease
MKQTTISAAFTALAITVIMTIGETILENKDLIELAGYFVALVACAIGFTWGLTEVFKVVKYDRETRQRLNRPYHGTTRDPDHKRRDHIYLFAVGTGFVTTEAVGTVFLLMDGATRNMIIVVCVLWTMFAGTVGMLNPVIYRKVFYKKGDLESEL